VRIGSGLNYLLLFLVAFTMFYPMYYVLVFSLSDAQRVGTELLFVPKGLTFRALEFVLGSHQIQRAYLNTVFLVCVGTFSSILVTGLYAWPLACHVRGTKVITILTVFTILFSGGFVPTFMVVRMTGLINSLWSLIIPMVINPFYVILMIKFFESIPDSLPESAKIDGANDFTVLFRIIIPLSLPAIAAVSLFYAVNTYWNRFFEAIIYISDPKKHPIQVVLRELLLTQQEEYFEGGASGESAGGVVGENLRMAVVVVSTVPILIIYPFVQKYFAKGVMIGAVKG
jgi:putative aldouronate transport system permease protein